MAAGLGFKTFTTGEVLTAADTNGYLMQGINVFASTAARDAAITSPQEGQFAYTKDTNSLWYYTGSAWAASGATGDIEGVTAGVGISGGGTSGTVTVTNSMATAIDAKGDLIAGTAADTFDRLAVGTNGQTLVADSTASTGLKWATPASGGQTLISTTSLSGVSTAISSIPQTYKDLKLVIVSFAPNNADKLRVTVNGGTVCGYTGQYVEGSAPTTTVNYSEAGNGVGYATVTGVNCRTAGGGGNSTHSATVIFYDYTNATDQKNGIFISNALTPSNYAQLSQGGFYTSNGAATTAINIQWNGTNTFSAGTAYLYGVA
jgi:hypothetical protein